MNIADIKCKQCGYAHTIGNGCEPQTPTPVCQCPECGETISCERVHNGIGYVYHAVHCGWGHEVTPLNQTEMQTWPAGWRKD